MTRNDDRMFVESIVSQGLYTDQEVEEMSARLGAKRIGTLTTAAIAIALVRTYKSAPTREGTTQYAQTLAANYGGDDVAVKRFAVEGVIRAAYGETHFIEDMDVDDIVPHQVLVAYDLFNKLGLDEPGFHKFVGEVLDLATEQSS